MPLVSFKHLLSVNLFRDSKTLFDNETQCILQFPTNTDVQIISTKAPRDPIKSKISNARNIQFARVSPDFKYLAVLRWPKSVEFVALNDVTICTNPTALKSSKTSAEVFGFHWITDDLIAYVTNIGIELVQFMRAKQTFKTLKTFSFTMYWYQYLPASKTLICSSGTYGTVLHTFQFQHGSVVRSAPLTLADKPLSPAVTPANHSLRIFPRNIFICELYKHTFIAVIEKSSETLTSFTFYRLKGQEVVSTGIVVDLKIEKGCRCAAIDNLIIVDDLQCKKSFILDLGQPSGVAFFISDSGIEPLQIPISSPAGNTSSAELISPYATPCDFFPDGLVFLSSGFLCCLRVDIQQLSQQYENLYVSCMFVSRRDNSTLILLDLLRKLLATKPPVRKMGDLFDYFFSFPSKFQWIAPSTVDLTKNNSAQHSGHRGSGGQLTTRDSHPATTLQSIHATLSSMTLGGSSSSLSSTSSMPLLDVIPKQEELKWAMPTQDEICTFVFYELLEDATDGASDDDDYYWRVMVEYLRTLSEFNQTISPLVYEILLNLSSRKKAEMNTLSTLTTRGVIADSSALVAALLQQRPTDEYCDQLLLDVYKREEEHDSVISYLLDRHLLLEALKYTREHNLLKSIDPKKFLASSLVGSSNQTFYITFKFMEQRNIFLYNSSKFRPQDGCDEYVEQFRSIFRHTTTTPAKQ